MKSNTRSEELMMSERYRAHISVEVDTSGRPSNKRSWRSPEAPVAPSSSHRARSAARRGKS